MARASFSFSKQESEAFGYVARPIIRVTLRAQSGELFDTTALLDSGADVSMFSPSIAEIMGLKVRTGNRKIFRGLGGKVRGVPSPYSLERRAFAVSCESGVPHGRDTQPRRAVGYHERR